jgi:hypothetical protein
LSNSQYLVKLFSTSSCAAFSSSDVIALLITQYGKDSFEYEIRQTFKSKIKAKLWETKFLTKVNARHNEKFLNQTNTNGSDNIRNAGEYEWRFNPECNKQGLFLKTSKLENNWISGKRKSDHKQKGRIVITEISTGNETRISKDEIIPEGWIKGRIRHSPTYNTIWIFHESTLETKAHPKNLQIPDGWLKGNKLIKNKGRVGIFKYENNEYVQKKIMKNELEFFLDNGWSQLLKTKNLQTLTAAGRLTK